MIIRQETETGIVDLTQFGEDEVDCLLHYIYTGSTDFSITSGDHNWLISISGVDVLKHFPAMVGITASIPIWKLGDFFCLDDLCKLALRGRDEYFRRYASAFSASGIDHPLAPKNIRVIVQTVQAVYSEERTDVNNEFRPPLLAFLLSCIHRSFFDDKVFKELLHELPEFSADWATALANSLGSNKVLRRFSDKCKQCGASVSKLSVNFAAWIKEHRAEFFCQDCFPLPRLEDWTGESSKGN